MSYNHGRSPDSRGTHQGQRAVPTYSAMTEYYDKQGHLKREVFIDWPRQLAAALRVSRSSLRRTFDHVTALRVRMQMGELPESVLRPGIPQLHRFAEYQAGRRVFDAETKNFIQCHCNAIGHDQRKFEGFYQLFQGIMAYLTR